MTSITFDKIRVSRLEQESIVQPLEYHLGMDQSNQGVDFEQYVLPDDIWASWNSDELNHHLSYLFFDSANPKHSTIQRMGDQWMSMLDSATSYVDVALKVHQAFAPFCDSSSLNARTLMNIELSLLFYMAREMGIKLADIHAYEARTLFNEYQAGICWPLKDTWCSLPFGLTSIETMNMDHYASVELNGRSPQFLYPNGQRKGQDLQVIDIDHEQVIQYVNNLFSDGVVGNSVRDIINTIHDSMHSFDYIADVKHEWQSLDTIFNQGGGDCEDLAHLEVSLLARALIDAGFVDSANQLTVVAGNMGTTGHRYGHTVIQFEHKGQVYVLDSTSREGLVLKQAFVSVHGWKDLVLYSRFSDLLQLQRAASIDTAELTSSDVTGLEAQFLVDLGLTDYFKSAKSYYEAVIDTSQNTVFWNLEYDATNIDDIDDEALTELGISSDTEERDNVAIDFNETVFVAENSIYFDSLPTSGLEGLISRVENRREEMSFNLTNTNLSKYTGQMYSGYYVYDYARIMRDYTDLINSIQSVTAYMSAMVTYSNAYNWIGSQLSNDDEPNSNVKERQRLIKSIQGSLLHMVGEVEYFVSTFTQTYDDLNSALYANYQQEVQLEFQSLDSAMRDMWGVGSETVLKNYLLEKVHAEYFHACAKNRINVQQASVDMPNSRALAQYMNFSDPYSDVLSLVPGSPSSFAAFQRELEFDIANDNRIFANFKAGDDSVEAYVDAIHYYFPWYFSEIPYFNADGDRLGFLKEESDTIASLLTSDSLMRYESLGLELGYDSFNYIHPNWVANLDIAYTDNKFIVTDKDNLNANNYKTSSVYKYFHARAMPYHTLFENEIYKDGFSEENVGSWASDPSQRVFDGTRKARIHQYDFVDILDFDLDFKLQDSLTSSAVFEVLKEKSYLDNTGRFTDTFIEDFTSGTITLPEEYNDYKQQILDRIYRIFSIDDQMVGQIDYDFSTPKLAFKANGSDGYINIKDNTDSDDDDYEFLTDYFNLGTTSFDSALETTDGSLEEEIEDGMDPINSVVFSEFNIIDWSDIDDTLLNSHGATSSNYAGLLGGYDNWNELTVRSLREFLKGSSGAVYGNFYNDTTGAVYGNFYNETTSITSQQQEAFYTQSLALEVNNLNAVDEDDKVGSPAGYVPYDIDNDGNSTTYYELPTGELWYLPDFLNDIQMVDQSVDTVYSTAGVASENVTLNLPVSSTDYSFDYGRSNKLPYDERIVSEVTQDTYPTVGPLIFDNIYYIDESFFNENGEIIDGFNLVDLQNADEIKEFQGYFSSDSNVDDYRQWNSLEREMTPVHSYNDSSVIFTKNEIFEYSEVDAESDDVKDAFLEFLVDNEVIVPSFRRITSGDFENYYIHHGYFFSENFEYMVSDDYLDSWNNSIPFAQSSHLTNLKSEIDSKLQSKWEAATFDDMNNFLGNVSVDNPGQLLRTIGKSIDEDLYGIHQTPFLGYEWETLKSAHNGMISTHNRIRIFYFVMQAYVTAIQSVAKKLDNLATTGTDPIEAEVQLFEKRLVKQTERYRQLTSKTNLLIEVNNAYYKQKIQSLKDSDLVIRAAKGANLYGNLTGTLVYIASLAFSVQKVAPCALAASSGMTNAVAVASCAFYTAAWTISQNVANAMIIIANAANVTEAIMRQEQEYKIPQMMETALMKFDLDESDENNETTFKHLMGYKRPFSSDDWNDRIKLWNDYDDDNFENDDDNFENEGDLNSSVYEKYSPLLNNDYSYVSDANGKDNWNAPATTVTNKSGDCEDYALLAASVITSYITSNGGDTNHYRILSGIVGYGGLSPYGHTVLAYDSTGEFKFNGSPDKIDIIDLTKARDDDGFYNFNTYQNQYGHFEPLFMFEKGASDITLLNDHSKMDIFAFESGGDTIGPTEPKGPKDIGPITHNGYDYTFDQQSQRRTIIYVHEAGTDTLVSSTSLDQKIQYGVSSYPVETPDGDTVALTLDGNYDSSQDSLSGDVTKNNVTNRMLGDGGSEFESAYDSDGVESEIANSNTFSDSHESMSYESSAIIPTVSPSGFISEGSNSGNISMYEMQELLKLEFQEHALVMDMYEISQNPLDISYGDSASFGSAEYLVMDWPKFQGLQRRLFIIQEKMKKIFLLMKLKAEFIALIGSRLSENQRKQVSSAIDSIFSSHFSQMSDTVHTMQLIMNNIQSASQSNFQVKSQQVKSTINLGYQIAIEVVMTGLQIIPDVGQFLVGFARPFAEVIKKTVEFFGNPYNAFYLDSVDELRAKTSLVDENDEFTNLGDLFVDAYTDAVTYDLSRDDYTIDDVTDELYSTELSNDGYGLMPYDASSYEDTSKYKTMNEIQQDKDFDLNLSDVIDSRGVVANPTMQNIYFGTYSAPQSTSLEDEVIRSMSRRFFPDNGDKLMFLGAEIYAMAGTKQFTDEEFLDWMQQRMVAEMQIQMFYSMYTSSIRSLAANLGMSQTGSNDSIEMSTTIVGDTGTHYFDVQATLGLWEQVQLTANEMRFSQYKILDQLILEGIVSIGLAVVGALLGGASKVLSTASTATRHALTVSAKVFMEAAKMGADLAALIYSAVDAQEENRAMDVLAKDEDFTDDAEYHDDDNPADSAAKHSQRKLNEERREVAQESVKTAGQGTFGFNSTYVDQSAKIKLKRKIKEMFKLLEVVQTVNSSQADFVKQLASNLGFSTSQNNAGGALSRVQQMAESATNKAVDARFEILEAHAKRENAISQATRNMVVQAVSVGASLLIKAVSSRFKKKQPTDKASGNAMGNNAVSFLTSLVKAIATAGFAETAREKLEDHQKSRDSKNEETRKREVEGSEEASVHSSSRAGQLAGLEQRGMNAQFLSGSVSEMNHIIQLLTEISNTVAAPINEMIKTIMKMMNEELEGIAAEMNENVKAEESNTGTQGGSSGNAGTQAQVGMIARQFERDKKTGTVVEAKQKRNKRIALMLNGQFGPMERMKYHFKDSLDGKMPSEQTVESLRQNMKGLGDSMKEFGDPMKKFGDSMKKFGDPMKKFGDSMKNFGDFMKKFGDFMKGLVPDQYKDLSDKRKEFKVNKNRVNFNSTFDNESDLDKEFSDFINTSIENVNKQQQKVNNQGIRAKSINELKKALEDPAQQKLAKRELRFRMMGGSAARIGESMLGNLLAFIGMNPDKVKRFASVGFGLGMAVGLVGFLAGGLTLKVESAMDSRRFSDTQKLSRFKDAAVGLSLMDVGSNTNDLLQSQASINLDEFNARNKRMDFLKSHPNELASAVIESGRTAPKETAKRIQHLVKNYPDVAVQLISQFPDDVKNSMKNIVAAHTDSGKVNNTEIVEFLKKLDPTLVRNILQASDREQLEGLFMNDNFKDLVMKRAEGLSKKLSDLDNFQAARGIPTFRDLEISRGYGINISLFSDGILNMLDEMKKKVKEDKELDLEAQRRIAASAMVMFTQSGFDRNGFRDTSNTRGEERKIKELLKAVNEKGAIDLKEQFQVFFNSLTHSAQRKKAEELAKELNFQVDDSAARPISRISLGDTLSKMAVRMEDSDPSKALVSAMANELEATRAPSDSSTVNDASDGRLIDRLSELANSNSLLEKMARVVAQKAGLEGINKETSMEEIETFATQQGNQYVQGFMQQFKTVVPFGNDADQSTAVTPENYANIQNFISPDQQGSLPTADPDGTIKPAESEFIRRFVQVTLRAVSLEHALPVKPEQLDHNATIDNEGNNVGNVTSPDNQPPIQDDNTSLPETSAHPTTNAPQDVNPSHTGNTSDGSVELLALSKKVQDAKNTLQQAQADHDDKIGDLNQAKAAQSQCLEENTQALTALDDAQSEFEKASEQLEEFNKGLDKKDDFQNPLTFLNQEKESLLDEDKEIDKLLKGLEDSSSSTEINLNFNENIQDIEQQIAKKNNEIKSQEGLFKQLQERGRILNESINELNSNITQLDLKKNKINNIQTSIQNEQLNIENIKKELMELKAEKDKLDKGNPDQINEEIKSIEKELISQYNEYKQNQISINQHSQYSLSFQSNIEFNLNSPNLSIKKVLGYAQERQHVKDMKQDMKKLLVFLKKKSCYDSLSEKDQTQFDTKNKAKKEQLEEAKKNLDDLIRSKTRPSNFERKLTSAIDTYYETRNNFYKDIDTWLTADQKSISQISQNNKEKFITFTKQLSEFQPTEQEYFKDEQNYFALKYVGTGRQSKDSRLKLKESLEEVLQGFKNSNIEKLTDLTTNYIVKFETSNRISGKIQELRKQKADLGSELLRATTDMFNVGTQPEAKINAQERNLKLAQNRLMEMQTQLNQLSPQPDSGTLDNDMVQLVEKQAELRHEQTTLSKNMVDSSNDIQKLKSDTQKLESNKQKLIDQQNQAQDVQKLLIELKEQKNKVQNKLSSVNTQIDQINKNKKAYEDDVKSTQDNLNVAYNEARDAVREKTSNLTESSERLNDANMKVKQAQTNLEKARKSVDDLTKSLTDSTDKVAAAEAAAAKAAAAEAAAAEAAAAETAAAEAAAPKTQSSFELSSIDSPLYDDKQAVNNLRVELFKDEFAFTRKIDQFALVDEPRAHAVFKQMILDLDQDLFLDDKKTMQLKTENNQSSDAANALQSLAGFLSNNPTYMAEYQQTMQENIMPRLTTFLMNVVNPPTPFIDSPSPSSDLPNTSIITELTYGIPPGTSQLISDLREYMSTDTSDQKQNPLMGIALMDNESRNDRLQNPSISAHNAYLSMLSTGNVKGGVEVASSRANLLQEIYQYNIDATDKNLSEALKEATHMCRSALQDTTNDQHKVMLQNKLKRLNKLQTDTKPDTIEIAATLAQVLSDSIVKEACDIEDTAMADTLKSKVASKIIEGLQAENVPVTEKEPVKPQLREQEAERFRSQIVAFVGINNWSHGFDRINDMQNYVKNHLSSFDELQRNQLLLAMPQLYDTQDSNLLDSISEALPRMAARGQINDNQLDDLDNFAQDDGVKSNIDAARIILDIHSKPPSVVAFNSLNDQQWVQVLDNVTDDQLDGFFSRSDVCLSLANSMSETDSTIEAPSSNIGNQKLLSKLSKRIHQNPHLGARLFSSIDGGDDLQNYQSRLASHLQDLSLTTDNQPYGKFGPLLKDLTMEDRSAIVSEMSDQSIVIFAIGLSKSENFNDANYFLTAMADARPKALNEFANIINDSNTTQMFYNLFGSDSIDNKVLSSLDYNIVESLCDHSTIMYDRLKRTNPAGFLNFVTKKITQNVGIQDLTQFGFEKDTFKTFLPIANVALLDPKGFSKFLDAVSRSDDTTRIGANLNTLVAGNTLNHIMRAVFQRNSSVFLEHINELPVNIRECFNKFIDSSIPDMPTEATLIQDPSEDDREIGLVSTFDDHLNQKQRYQLLGARLGMSTGQLQSPDLTANLKQCVYQKAVLSKNNLKNIKSYIDVIFPKKIFPEDNKAMLDQCLMGEFAYGDSFSDENAYLLLTTFDGNSFDNKKNLAEIKDKINNSNIKLFSKKNDNFKVKEKLVALIDARLAIFEVLQQKEPVQAPSSDNIKATLEKLIDHRPNMTFSYPEYINRDVQSKLIFALEQLKTASPSSEILKKCNEHFVKVEESDDSSSVHSDSSSLGDDRINIKGFPEGIHEKNVDHMRIYTSALMDKLMDKLTENDDNEDIVTGLVKLSQIVKSHPAVMDREFRNKLDDLLKNSLKPPKSLPLVHLPFSEFIPYIQQMLVANMPEQNSEVLSQLLLVDRTVQFFNGDGASDSFQLKQGGYNHHIDTQQQEMFQYLNQQMGILPSSQKKTFLSNLSKKIQNEHFPGTPVKRAAYLARARAVHQVMTKEDPNLVQGFSEKIMTKILQGVPMSTRSMDNMIHLMKDLDSTSQESFAAKLFDSMGSKVFNMFQQHANVPLDPLHTSLFSDLSKTLSKVYTKKIRKESDVFPHVVTRFAKDLAGCIPSELREKAEALANDATMSDVYKGHVIAELLVKDEKQFFKLLDSVEETSPQTLKTLVGLGLHTISLNQGSRQLLQSVNRKTFIDYIKPKSDPFNPVIKNVVLSKSDRLNRAMKIVYEKESKKVLDRSIQHTQWFRPSEMENKSVESVLTQPLTEYSFQNIAEGIDNAKSKEIFDYFKNNDFLNHDDSIKPSMIDKFNDITGTPSQKESVRRVLQNRLVDDRLLEDRFDRFKDQARQIVKSGNEFIKQMIIMNRENPIEICRMVDQLQPDIFDDSEIMKDRDIVRTMVEALDSLGFTKSYKKHKITILNKLLEKVQPTNVQPPNESALPTEQANEFLQPLVAVLNEKPVHQQSFYQAFKSQFYNELSSNPKSHLRKSTIEHVMNGICNNPATLAAFMKCTYNSGSEAKDMLRWMFMAKDSVVQTLDQKTVDGVFDSIDQLGSSDDENANIKAMLLFEGPDQFRADFVKSKMKDEINFKSMVKTLNIAIENGYVDMKKVYELVKDDDLFKRLAELKNNAESNVKQDIETFIISGMSAIAKYSTGNADALNHLENGNIIHPEPPWTEFETKVISSMQRYMKIDETDLTRYKSGQFTPSQGVLRSFVSEFGKNLSNVTEPAISADQARKNKNIKSLINDLTLVEDSLKMPTKYIKRRFMKLDDYMAKHSVSKYDLMEFMKLDEKKMDQYMQMPVGKLFTVDNTWKKELKGIGQTILNNKEVLS